MWASVGVICRLACYRTKTSNHMWVKKRHLKGGLTSKSFLEDVLRSEIWHKNGLDGVKLRRLEWCCAGSLKQIGRIKEYSRHLICFSDVTQQALQNHIMASKVQPLDKDGVYCCPQVHWILGCTSDRGFWGQVFFYPHHLVVAAMRPHVVLQLLWGRTATDYALVIGTFREHFRVCATYI